MTALRTVTVLEHETLPVVEPSADAPSLAHGDAWITETDARRLLAINERRKGFCVRTIAGVRLAQFCGIVRLRTCVLEVLPKFGMAEIASADETARSRVALLRMLHSARTLAIVGTDDARQQSVEAPLLDVFIEAFLACALDCAKRGLIGRYVADIDDLRVVKGRYLLRQNVLRNAARPHLVHCEHDRFDADNPYNRAVRAALDACRGWIRQPSVQRRWLETCARYEGVACSRATAADVARLPRDRTTRRYEPVLRWCELLLSLDSPALAAGDTSSPGLLFDMNRLFESYVGRLERANAGEHDVVRTHGHRRALAVRGGEEAFALQPDVTVSHADAPVDVARIVDAKWKRLDPDARNWGVSRDDVHQMLAYAVRYRCRRIELVYPEPERALRAAPPTFDIALGDEAAPVRVAVRTVPLWD